MDPKRARRLLAGLAFAAACAAPAGASIITVNSAADVEADDGQCTLREAITAANRNVKLGQSVGECSAGSAYQYPRWLPDLIRFRIGGGTGPVTIRPAVPLPAVTEAVFIDGYSQPGSRANRLLNGSDAVLRVELRGDRMAPDCEGRSPVPGAAFQFVGGAASGSRLRGVAITGLRGHPAAIVIFRASGVQIDGNFIGFDASGQALENDGDGIVVLNGAFEIVDAGDPPRKTPIDDGGNGNLIGGRSPAERNVIGGGGRAVFLGGQGNRVQGNYLGVNPQGEQSFPPRLATLVAGDMGILACWDPRRAFHFVGRNNTIGGLGSGTGNFFSAAPSECAVALRASGNQVQGNFMGTARDGGAGPSGSGLSVQPACGVVLHPGGDQNVITYNTIAFNSVGISTGGTSGQPAAGNDISANSIHSNAILGIDLAMDGVSANDPLDADQGPNGLQNFPERLSATLYGVRGDVKGKPDTAQRIDFYQSQRCHSSGKGEGEKYLSSAMVLTDSSGKASFHLSVPGLQLEQFVTATATTADGTSEFSSCATVFPGAALTVDVRSSRNPSRSHEQFRLTVRVKGSFGVPRGRVRLDDLAHTTVVNGKPGFHSLGEADLVPVSGSGDTAEALIDSASLYLKGSRWGNLRIRAEYLGDAMYAATASTEVVQTIYREKSDFDGDGLSDLLLCNSRGEKSLVQYAGGSFTGPTPLPMLNSRTVLGTAEFDLNSEPAVVWRDASGAMGATMFGANPRDLAIPMPPGLTFEGLGSLYGDLKDDFVVRDAAGQHFGVLTDRPGPSTLPLLQPWAVDKENIFLVEQVGDFNGDGNLDWHFRHPVDMSHVLWLLGTFKLVGGGYLAYVPSGGRVVATGDFDGDGRTDFVWAWPTGEYELALQNGLATLERMLLSMSASQEIVGTALLDDGSGNASSNGRSSLIVRDTANGDLEAWINTGPNSGLPVFVARAIPTNGSTDLTMCVP